ncbi:MAG: IclR family transcriptional regulator [Dehalococcoidia bacterium]
MSKAVGRSLDVIAALVQSGTPLSAGEVATSLNLGRTSVYRLVEALESDGWITGEGSPKRYQPSFRIIEVAAQSLHSLRFREALVPFLADLARLVPAQVLLNYYRDGEVVITDGAVLDGGGVRTFTLGRRHPAGVTASGKILMAYLSAAEIRAVAERGLPQLTRFTRATPDELIASIEQCRRLGYGVADREITEESSALAVPVFSRDGRPAAAIGLSLSGPLNEGLVSAVLPDALATARAASAMLGGRVPNTTVVS